MVDRRVNGDQHFIRFWHRNDHGLSQDGGRVFKCLTPMASIHAGELFLFVHGDVNKKISPYTLSYLRRFLMAGVAFQDQIGGTGMLEKLRTVKFLQRCQVGQPWTDGLASP